MESSSRASDVIHLLSASTLSDAFSVSVHSAAAVLKGRILIEQGKFPEAAAAVASVPTNFQLLATFSLTSGSNQIWSLNTSAKRWTVGDSFDVTGILKNSLPFASAKDPRIPVTGTTLGTSPAGRGFDNANVRTWQAGLSGLAQRAHAAHLNSFEAFPLFATAVIVARLNGADQGRVDTLSIAFIGLRLLFGVLYLAD